MSGEPVLAEARDGVLEITLNRPAVRNAVNAAVAEGAAAALDRLDGGDDLRARQIRGLSPQVSPCRVVTRVRAPPRSRCSQR